MPLPVPESTLDHPPPRRRLIDRAKIALLVLALSGLVAGLVLRLAGSGAWAEFAWRAGVVPVLVALVVEIWRSLRRGDVGLDIVAALSMAAALVFGETLAAAVVALMYSGGTFLESFAEGRARRSSGCVLPGSARPTSSWSRATWGSRAQSGTNSWGRSLKQTISR